MAISPNQCSVFIQVWVDVNAFEQGKTRGCYAVSNQAESSTGEGTANLVTKVVSGSNVCWSVVPIDPQYNGLFSIVRIDAESGWNPPPAPVSPTPPYPIYTGKLAVNETVGAIPMDIVFSYNGGADAITITLPVKVIPVEKTD